MTSEETARFTAAKERIIGKNRERNGIGTLSEKTVHAVLKNYYAPDETQHEYKLLNGWSRDKKRGSSRYDRIPVSIEREMEFTCAQDYVQLIPYDLPEPFTSAQLAKAVQIRKEQAGIVCNILHDLGVMKREGKKGNAYLYRVVEV